MISFLVAFILLGIPFFFIPSLQLGFEPPKVILFELLTAVLLIVSLFKSSFASDMHKVKQPLLFVFFGVFAITLIQIILGKAQLLGNVFRFQGVLTLWLLMIWALLSSTVSYKIKPIIPVVLLVIQALIMFVVGPNAAHRYIGSLGEPNALAAFIVFLTVFLFFEKAWWKWVFIAVSSFMVALTHSQSGILSLGVVFLLWFFVTHRMFPLKTAVIICITVTLLALFVPFIQMDSFFENRSDIWKTAVQAGAVHSFMGNGFGNVPKALKQPGLLSSLTVQNNLVDSSHNILLDWWVQGGIGGLALFLVLLYLALTDFINEKSLEKTLFFLAAFIPLLFNPASIAGLVIFWWVVGSSFYSSSLPSSFTKKNVV